MSTRMDRFPELFAEPPPVRTEDPYRLLIESLHDCAVVMLDPAGRIRSWHAGAVKLYGYGAEQIVGEHLARLYAPEQRREGAPWDDLERAQARGCIDAETLRARRDGTLFPARTLLSPLHDASGRLCGYSSITYDLAARTQIRALEESSRRMHEFLALLSHELRNPLAAIRHAAALLRGRPVQEQVLQAAGAIVDHQAAHMAGLVEDLFDVSRIAHGALSIQRSAVTLTDVVTRATETSAPLIQARRHTLHVAPFDAALAVDGDLVRLTQIVTNLLGNAAKYTPPGGQIWLGVRAVDGEVEISVRDNGRGISAELLPRVFEFFVQAERAPSTGTGGLGIGLGLVRELAALHGGRVEAHSEGLGRGAEFIVRLPARPRTSTLPRAAERGAAPAAGAEVGGAGAADGAGCAAAVATSRPALSSRPRVLVVDDDVDSGVSLQLLLEGMGYRTARAQNALEALETARALRPELALLDIGMPRMNGYELADRLRQEHGRRCMLVAVSGWARDAERERAAGFSYHLVKPFGIDQLGGILEATLAHRTPLAS